MARDTGRLPTIVSLAVTLALVGCGTATTSPAGSGATGGQSAQPAEIANLPDLGLHNVTSDTAAARALNVGPEGGTVTATGASGVRFSLSIPAHALPAPTQVALYPASAVTGLPSGASLSAAVQFAPDGLQLQLPATLTIVFPAAPSAASMVGVTWQGDGKDPHGYPLVVSGNTATLRIYHFSGVGAGDVPLEPIDECTTQADMEVGVTDAIHAAAAGKAGARQAFTDILKRCYRNFVEPALKLSGGGEFVAAAIVARNAYDFWFAGITFWAAGFFPGFTVDPELGESRPLAAAFLRNWFDTFNAQCIANADNAEAAVIAAEQAIDMPHDYAPSWGIDTRANRLDYESLLNDLCVKIVIDPSRGFSGSQPGAQGKVTVPVGYTVAGQAVRHDRTIHVKLNLTGNSTAFAEDDAPADGTYTAPLTWPANVNPLRIDVLASFPGNSEIAVFDRITKSPGSKIVVGVRDSSGNVRIGVMDADGRNLTLITSGPGDWHPAWSPSGKQIAFTQRPSTTSASTVIEVMNADGSGLTPLTTGPYDSAPAWSPDGTRIAFLRGHPNTASPFPTIVIMSADGSNQVDTGVSASGGAKLSWSPDGQRLAYADYDDKPDAKGNKPFRIWLMNATGGGKTKLVTSECEPWGAAWPDWSPTGDLIAFYCVTHGNPNAGSWIAVMSSTGGGFRKVTGNIAGQPILGAPTWSPDGTKFATADSTGVLIYDAGAGTSRTVGVGGAGTVAFLDWGP